MREVVLLLSGGLDGLLAAAVLLERGVAVRPLHAETGFVHPARRRSIAALQQGRVAPVLAPLAGRVEVVDVRAPYLAVLRTPRHGVGGGSNPCLDCRPLMLRAALRRAGPAGAVATGDVLGQRALDQSRKAFASIDRDGGAGGRVLRPLSAALLETPAGIPWGGALAWPAVHGRSRRDQRDLAERYGLAFEPVPSGGCCRLADAAFSRRLRDCLEHEPQHPDEACMRRLEGGRHVRLGWAWKAVVARDAEEGAWLEGHVGDCWVAQAADGRGALVVGEGRADESALLELAAVAGRFSAHRDLATVPVRLTRSAPVAVERLVRVAPIADRRIRDGRL